jgi:hypothetical protein
MAHRRSEFDVTNRIDTTEPGAVAGEIRGIYERLYQRAAPANLMRAFGDLARLYRGEFPGYHPCDTDYHDIQHVLDVTLAMGRLMDGCVRTANGATIGAPLFALGVVTALFHDCGYIRHLKDTKHHYGAEYTLTHVSRGARFLHEYLPTIGMGELAVAASRVIHFTGYEMPVSRIRVPAPEYRLVGNLLGSADILAQMADRCYLEKCYGRLYPEFVLGGVTRRRSADASEEILYRSAAELVLKVPSFYEVATRRLDQDLGAHYVYAERHFGDQNLYLEEVAKNVEHARSIGAHGDLTLLRRQPPTTIADPEDEDQPRLL